MSAEDGFAQIEVLGTPEVTADDSRLKAVDLGPGFELPESYRAFAREMGYGLLCDLFIIYIPMEGKGDSLEVRSKALQAVIAETIADDLFEYEPDGSLELAQRLIPFGISENGHTLAWDPDETTGPGEHPIYAIGSKFLAVNRAAPDLFSFVERCQDDRVKSILGPGYKPLPSRFQPMRVGWKPV